jgi:exosortase A-associated hydrolase 2
VDSLAAIAGPASETPFFFPNERYRLFGIVHRPVGEPSGEAWVFCHPFAEEKLWTHRTYVSFARTLAARGAWVLRFDAMGNGDSGGQFHEASLETMLSDINCAIRWLMRQGQPKHGVGLLGLRLGGTMAALVAEHCEDVRTLILWEPIVDGEKYMQELLRVNLTTQTAVYKEIRHNREALVRMMREGATVNIDGYQLAYPCFEQVAGVKLGAEPKRFQGPCLIMQIGRDGQQVRQDMASLKERYGAAEIRCVVEEPFWKEIKQWYGKAPALAASTLDWLEQR